MTFGPPHSPSLSLSRWAAVCLLAATTLVGEEMREIAPGSRQGQGQTRPEIQSADQIRPPLLDRLGSFDLRSGRVPSAAPDPGPVPSASGEMSPAQRKKALELLDRRRNWLIENAATLHRIELDGDSSTPGGDEEPGEALNPGMTRSLQRLLEATERPGAEDPRRGSAGMNTRQGRLDQGLGSLDGGEATNGASEADKRRTDVGVRLIPEDGLADSKPASGMDIRPDRNGAGSVFGIADRRPGAELFPDQRRDTREEDPAMAALATRRAGAFEEMLATRIEADGSAPSEGASSIFGRSADARSSAFQTLLQAREWDTGPGPVGANLFAPPTGQASAPAARSIDIPTTGRSALPPAFTPAVAAPRPAAPRIETRPLVLPVPTRSAF